jgi:hypothetical protein
MYDPLGLSIGTTNLVAVRVGETPVTRRSMLTLFADRVPEVGVPEKNHTLPTRGRVVSGFVQRVGDPAPLAASDGSIHDPSLLLIEAIDAMVNATGADAASSQLAIAVPAHWEPAAQRGLQDALATHAGLSTLGGPAYVVSDAVAALTALTADRALPDRGVVALLDFGGSGTSITLADAGSGLSVIDQTRRYHEFSGDRIDEALLAHVLTSIGPGGEGDPGETAAVGQFAELRAECTNAKEQLSAQPTTDLVADLPGSQFSVRVTRAELEQLIETPLDGAIGALEDMLERNTIRWSNLAAVATVGGGAGIPLITQRLSSRGRVPVVTSQHPALDMAVGAAMLAARGTDANAATRAAPAAADAATGTALAAAVGATTSVTSPGCDDPELAWSQEELGVADEPVPYVGEPYDGGVDARPATPYELPPQPPERRRGYGLARLVVGAGALVATIALGGVAYTLANTSHTEAPPEPTHSTTVPAPPPPEPPSPAPVAPAPSVVPTTSSPAPPPPPPPPPPATTASPEPAPTTTTPSPTPTTTTPSPTPTTTSPSPTTTATTAPSPTTSTSTTVPMTTEYLTIPFVPVPIPVQVPGDQAPPPQNPFINQPDEPRTGGFPGP